MSPWPYNYHAHTPYGDGHSSAADYAAEALRRGMRCIGVSEHAPLGEDIDWTMAADRVDAYHTELTDLRRQYEGRLEIVRGLEFDWWPARNECWDRIRPDEWDYLIGSVHFVTTSGGTWIVDDSPRLFEKGVREAFGGDIRAACDAFFACERDLIASGRADILAHFDLCKKFNKNGRFFDSSASWYREMALTVPAAAAAAGIIVEVNTAGLDKPVSEYYPAPWLVEACVARGVRLTLSSDAHAASQIQRHFDRVLPELARLGVRELWRLTDGRWAGESLAAAEVE
ncbi:MAG TPA: histidinol-phosphatase [Armatimonadota bacterium]|nr:histidinol-phosphatase [Armatimonadota bacterium]